MVHTKADRTGYWKQTLEHFISSGLSQTEYTKQYKISLGSLHKWSKILAIPLTPSNKVSCKKEPEVLSFIELQSSPHSVQTPLKLELLGGGGYTIKAEITAGWDQVVALLKALAH